MGLKNQNQKIELAYPMDDMLDKWDPQVRYDLLKISGCRGVRSCITGDHCKTLVFSHSSRGESLALVTSLTLRYIEATTMRSITLKKQTNTQKNFHLSLSPNSIRYWRAQSSLTKGFLFSRCWTLCSWASKTLQYKTNFQLPVEVNGRIHTCWCLHIHGLHF